MYGIPNVKKRMNLGDGARFWAYISPQNDTAERYPEWSVAIEQKDGDWIGKINSDEPHKVLETPGLSGVFKVTVYVRGEEYRGEIEALSDSQKDVGCNSNCAAMVGIVADPNDRGAHYWTVWDALCRIPEK